MQRYDYQKNFGKQIEFQLPLARYAHTNCTSVSSNNMHVTFFFTIPFTISWDMTIKKILKKTELQLPLVMHMHKNCIIVFSNSIYLVYKFLWDFNRNRDLHIPKNLENVYCSAMFERFPPKVDNSNLCLDDTKYKISWNSVH